jgi:hypothetical protein
VHGGTRLAATLADGKVCTAIPTTPLLAVDDPAADFYPYPDAVLLRLESAPEDHPCVRLDAKPPALGDRFHLIGFTKGEHAGQAVVQSGAALRVEALMSEGGHLLFKFHEGQVIGGFSGAPLLNLRTGGVGAVLESTRSGSSALGGFGVPIAAIIAALDPDLLARNTAVAANRRWGSAVEQQAELEAERMGRRESLPLLDAVLPLHTGGELVASELLHPRYAAVGFVRRGDLLEQVMRWRESEAQLSVLVLIGGGGFGKTRTALEICRAATDAGWTAGLIDAEQAKEDGLAALIGWPGRLVVAVDYAETRPDLVAALLRRLRRRRLSASATRVLLMVRQRADRQELIDLFASGDAREEIAGLLRRAEWVGFGVGERELDRRALFNAAATAFVALATVPETDLRPVATPALDADHFARPLFVLAAALLATQKPVLPDVSGMSEYQLLQEILDRHESRYWSRAANRLGLDLHPDDQRVAVAVMAMVGLWSESTEIAAFRAIIALADASAERLMLVARWMRSLYGHSGVLEPDLLGEALIKQVIVAESNLLGRVIDSSSERQVTHCLNTMARMSVGDEEFRRVVYEILMARTDIVSIMDQRANFVPVCRILGFEIGPSLAEVLSSHSMRREDALQVAAEFGDMTNLARRLLAQDNPTEYLPQLSSSLYESIGHYYTVGEKPALRRRLAEAVEVYEAMRRQRLSFDQEKFEIVVALLGREANDSAVELLSEGKPRASLAQIKASMDAYAKLPPELARGKARDIAQAKVNYSYIVGLVYGQDHHEVLAAVQEALGLYKLIPSELHDREYFLALGQAYEQEAIAFKGAGALAESAASASRSAQSYRAHAEAGGEILPRLAMIELFQAQMLLEAKEPAQNAASRAMRSFEQLCDESFAEYGGSFSRAVDLLAEAVESDPGSTSRAIDIQVHAWRRLARRSGHGKARLATLLTDRAAQLIRLDFMADALAYVEEATAAFYADVAQNGSTGRQNLVVSLDNMAYLLRALGREADAEEADRKASEFRRLDDPQGENDSTKLQSP